MLLADMGANVIKVEQPGYHSEVMSRRPVVDRHKRSITLNLKTKEAQGVFYRLAEKSDVVVEQFRPGVTQRLGIDYETLKAKNPRIIYCSVTGFGQDGPYRNLPGHDPNYLATAGVLASPVRDGRCSSRNPISDLVGHACGIGILCALWIRQKTGTGQQIDISLTDAMVSWLGVTRGDAFFRTGSPFRLGQRPSHVYQTKEGKHICIAPIERHFWERLCRVLGVEEFIPYHREILIDEPRSPEKREEILSRLSEIFLTRTREEWVRLLQQEDIPISPVNDMEEAFQDPHILYRRMVEELEDPDLGKVRQVGVAIKLSKTPGRVEGVAPLPGEHTEQILKELNYRADEIERLREKGALG
jgi:crotonobetainyl-CoA:carnitine CoA-transferase CaiB-like acyl-CoA transferase